MDERKRFWAEHIEAFRASGQAQRAYCARHGLAPRSLRSWRTRLHGPVRPTPKENDAWTGGAGHGASHGACPVAEAAAPAVDVLGGPLVRRRWSDDEKRRLVYEGLRSGMGLGRFARMCGLQPSMLFRWRNTYALLVDLPAPSDVARDQPAFADVRIAPAPQPARTATLPATPAPENRAAPDLIEIVLDGGRLVRVGPDVDANVLAPRARGVGGWGVIAVPAGVRIHLALGATDMRKGMDGLALRVQEMLRQDPFICVGRDYVAASPGAALFCGYG